MTVGQFLKNAAGILRTAGIESARLDCLVLLEDVVGQDRSHLLAHPETILTGAQITALNNYITQRKNHVPLAYIRGKVAFFGRTFRVNNYVLIPRPETEAIIELLLKIPLPPRTRIADIGCGSGCIGITAALELSQANVTLYDIDSTTLLVAKQNAETLGAAVHLKRQDLLTNNNDPFDILLANLPYVPDDHAVNAAAKHEPKRALYSGPDGLDHYRKLWKQIAVQNEKPIYVILEALPSQHARLTELAQNANYMLADNKDFALLFSELSLKVGQFSGTAPKVTSIV